VGRGSLLQNDDSEGSSIFVSYKRLNPQLIDVEIHVDDIEVGVDDIEVDVDDVVVPCRRR